MGLCSLVIILPGSLSVAAQLYSWLRDQINLILKRKISVLSLKLKLNFMKKLANICRRTQLRLVKCWLGGSSTTISVFFPHPTEITFSDNENVMRRKMLVRKMLIYLFLCDWSSVKIIGKLGERKMEGRRGRTSESVYQRDFLPSRAHAASFSNLISK